MVFFWSGRYILGRKQPEQSIDGAKAMQTFSSKDEHMAWLETQSALPSGFWCGVAPLTFVPAEVPKPANMKLTLILAERPTPDFAAVFTQNAFPGAPVIIGRKRLDEPTLRAIIINNKISNVCAPNGVETSERLCTAVAQQFGMDAGQVLPSSTGIIGWQLPATEMCTALPTVANTLQSKSILPAAEGMMTTDLYPKVRRVDIGDGCIVGIAKGAGMIEPNLATMLVYILTDITVPRDELRAILAAAVAPSFNAISVDSDESTSDTVALMSSGVHACDDIEAFKKGVFEVCAKLAEDVVRNGEGVKHVVTCEVRNAPDSAMAKAIAKSVINSPLLQCAICGNDPNVGRLVCAVGKCVGNDFPGTDLSACHMAIGGKTVFSDGAFHIPPELETKLSDCLKDAELYESAPPDENGVFRPPVSWPAHEKTVDILVDLGCGDGAFTAIGGDRTHEYISENADYRS